MPLFLIYQDEPDYLEDCTGDKKCTNEDETCVVELVSTLGGNYTNSLYIDCSETKDYNDGGGRNPDTGLYDPPYAPLWQECFCIPKNTPEFEIVDCDDSAECVMLKDLTSQGICDDSGGFCPFPSLGQVIRFNSPTVSIFLY